MFASVVNRLHEMHFTKREVSRGSSDGFSVFSRLQSVQSLKGPSEYDSPPSSRSTRFRIDARRSLIYISLSICLDIFRYMYAALLTSIPHSSSSSIFVVHSRGATAPSSLFPAATAATTESSISSSDIQASSAPLQQPRDRGA